MFKRFFLIAGLLIAALSPASSQEMMMGMSGGPDGGSAAFVGPLDSLPVANPAFSLRRLYSAYVANKTIHVTCTGGTSSSGDVGFTTSGDFNTAVYNARVGTGSCTVDTWYDQSGNGNNATQGVGNDQPTVSLTATPHSKPTLVCVAANSTELDTGSITVNAPMTFAAVALRTASGTEQDIIGGNGITFYWETTAGGIQMFGSGLVNSAGGAATDNVFHEFVGIDDGASSSILVDGSSVASGNVGTGSTTTGFKICNGSAAGGKLTGDISELIVFSSHISGGNASTWQTNANSYW